MRSAIDACNRRLRSEPCGYERNRDFSSRTREYSKKNQVPFAESLVYHRFMCRLRVLSGLLVLLLTTSASVCITGWTGQSPSTCRRNSRYTRADTKQKNPTAVHSACGHVLESQLGRCGIRGFDQLQFVEFGPRLSSNLLLVPTDRVVAPACTKIVVSSIGSPETDRGPPRS